MRLALILALCSSGFAATVRVSCGGPGGVDASGNVWQGDGPYFTGGATWAMPGQQFPYNNLRFSNPPGSPFSYSITVNTPLTAGSHVVTLKFIEPNVTAVGKRRFSVSINGVQVVSNLDLFATVGLLKPYDLTFPVTASGVISVVLTPTTATDKAVISGIQIDDVAVSPPSSLPVPIFLVGLESAPPACPTTFGPGLSFFFATDTQHLFWCTASGDSIWHTVGDVRNATSLMPPLLALESCSGSGAGWNCAGLYHAKIGLEDGTYLNICGPDMVVPYGAWTTWSPVK